MASLKPTARKFVQTSFALLEPKIVDKKAERFGPPRWERSAGETFMLREPMISAQEWCLIDEAPRLSKLPESSLLTAALQRDSRIGPLLGKLVGTPTMSSQIEEEELKRELLWAVMRVGASFVYSEDAFSRGYEDWLSAVIAPTQEGVALAPLSLHFDGHLDLDDGLAITQLDDDEVSACLYVGAIRLAIDMRSDTAWVRNRTAIRFAYKLPRGLVETFSAEDPSRALASETAASELADKVVEALRLFKRGRVTITGRVVLRGGVHGGAMTWGASGPPRVPESEELVLTAAEAESFRQFWKVFGVARRNRLLAGVIRRFSYAGERARRDDEIVDLIAALEALLLSGEGGAELGFRTALRGAFFIDGSGLTRRKIKTQLRRGYSVRSAVAHGDEPSAKDLKAPNGDQITVEEFVNGIEELVRLAVSKAVGAVGVGELWPPDWDGLTLEGATYPNRGE